MDNTQAIIQNRDAQLKVVESQIKLYQEMRRINQEYITVLEDRIKKVDNMLFTLYYNFSYIKSKKEATVNNLPNCVPQDIYQPDELGEFDTIDSLDLFEIDRELAMLNKIESDHDIDNNKLNKEEK